VRYGKVWYGEVWYGYLNGAIYMDYDYFHLKVKENHWVIFKVDTYHNKCHSAVYNITKERGNYFCDCPAPKYCKHIDQIKNLKGD
jgi:hypothetical protein